MRNRKKKENYEVGYAKPPKSGKFKKGISGNPSGRPKRPSDFVARVLRELNSALVINENGKRRVITKDEAIAKQVVNKAVGGQVQYIRLVDIWCRQAIEKMFEKQQLANRTVEELTDEELIAIIRAESIKPEKSDTVGTDGLAIRYDLENEI